jgi:D-3-phosphoglycerate dehydrogenase
MPMGVELRGKTLGIVGIGRIGQATAKMALGLGMKVIAAIVLSQKWM